MNWGKGIIIVCALFISGMAFMVYTTMTKNIDLVTKNYYEEEIQYQQKIDKMNNSKELNEKIKIESTADGVLITYPLKNINGEVSLYRPSDAKKDIRIPASADELGRQLIPKGILESGLWKVQVSWNADGVEYFNEEKVVIQ